MSAVGVVSTAHFHLDESSMIDGKATSHLMLAECAECRVKAAADGCGGARAGLSRRLSGRVPFMVPELAAIGEVLGITVVEFVARAEAVAA